MDVQNMTNNLQRIEQYLLELAKTLDGQPASLIQDALHDSESHLLDALADDKNTNFDAILAEYGTPADVAQQYVLLEAQTQQFLSGKSRPPRVNGFFEPLFAVRNYQAIGYFLLSWPLSLVYFAWFAVVGVSTMALSVVGVGLPLLALYLKQQCYVALFEGQLVSTLLGERMPRRLYTSSVHDHAKSTLQKITSGLTTALGWKTTLYTAVHLPLTCLYVALCVGLFFASVALMLSPVIDIVIHYVYPGSEVDIAWYWLPLSAPAGIISLTLSLYLAGALSKLHRAIARALLIN
jgi:uncharacterized membrane protein